MKRKVIEQLLKIEEPTDELLQLIPADGDKATDTARLVLAAALSESRKQNLLDPADFYYRVCSSNAAQLTQFLQGTPAGKLTKEKMARSQAILTTLLTSKAGRPKTSTLSRNEQLAAAQRRRYEKKLNEEGRKQLNDFISAEAAAYLAAIKEIHQCESRAEALELVLQAAIKGKVLKVPAR